MSDEKVEIGQRWEHRDTFGVFFVDGPNTVTAKEGDDSWVMKRGIDGRILYMHHEPRLFGEWRRAPKKKGSNA